MYEPIGLTCLMRYLEQVETTRDLFRPISQRSQIDEKIKYCLVELTEIWSRLVIAHNALNDEELELVRKIKLASSHIESFIQRMFAVSSTLWDPMLRSQLIRVDEVLCEFTGKSNSTLRNLESGTIIENLTVPVHASSPSIATEEHDAPTMQAQLSSLSQLIAESQEYASLKADLGTCSLSLRLITEMSIPPPEKIEKRKKLHKRRRRDRDQEGSIISPQQ